MKKVILAIVLSVMVGCASVPLNSQLIKDLAWDVGYIGYVYSPQSQKYLNAGCAIMFAINDNEVLKKNLIDTLSQVWVDANNPQGVALVLVINNLVGQLGIDVNKIMTNEQILQVRTVVKALCDGVNQAKLIKK